MIRQTDSEAFSAVNDLLAMIDRKHTPREALFEERFSCANALFSASPHLLKTIGLNDSDALLIGSINALSRYAERTDRPELPLLNTLPTAAAYLVDSLHSLSEERFCLLCLDSRGRLIRDVLLQNGTDDSALFSLRALLAEVVRYDPSAVILSHNHPRHTLHPSREDIACTREALRALTVLAVPMLDHIIVAGKQAVSIRDNGFIPVELWLDQSPDHRLLRDWLKT